MSPYWGVDFFAFFQVLGGRIFHALLGSSLSMDADEVQIGVLSLIAVSCGLIGPFLVLKRMTMFANSLSHTILLGIVLAFLLTSRLLGGGMFSLSTLLLGSLAAAIFTAVLTEGMVRFFRLQTDASVGFVFSTLFALGVLLVTLFTRDVHLGAEAIMGNVDALSSSDLSFSAWLAGLNLTVICLFYRQFQVSSLDASYASTLGIRSGVFRFLLLILTAIVCVGAFRAVGVLLVLAFLTGPYLTARLFSCKLRALLCWSPALGILASWVGVALSRHILSVYGLPLSTGGLVVCVIGLFYPMAVIFKKMWNLIKERSSCAKKSLS